MGQFVKLSDYWGIHQGPLQAKSLQQCPEGVTTGCVITGKASRGQALIREVTARDKRSVQGHRETADHPPSNQLPEAREHH